MSSQRLALILAAVAVFGVLAIGASGAVFAQEETPTEDETETPILVTGTPQEETPAPNDQTPTPENQTPAVDNETPAMGNETPAADNETANVTFENQTSNGSAVVVNATLPEGGFVAVHSLNETANLTAENGTVNQTASNDTNQTATNATANQTTTNQTAANDTTGQNVTTLQSVNNSTIGTMLGNSTYLDAGTQENVTVMLNESLTESQVLIAVAHRDTDGNQQFDAENDTVYVDGDQPVADWAFVNVTTDEMNVTDGMNATGTTNQTNTTGTTNQTNTTGA